MIDLVLTIAELAVFPFLLAAIGGYLAAKVLDDEKQRKLFIGTFIVLFVCGVLFSSIRETRAARADELRNKTIRDMYGQITVMVGLITHPAGNMEHQNIVAMLNGLSDKLKIPKPVIPKPEPTPEQKLRAMNTEQLRNYTIDLAQQMRNFEAAFMQIRFATTINRPRIQTNDENLLRQEWQQEVQQEIAQSTEHESEFRNKYWGAAHSLRDELLDRYKRAGKTPPTVGYMQGEANSVLDMGSTAGADPIAMAANYLEALARGLP